MPSFGLALSSTLVYMLGSLTFGFIIIFPTPGLNSMRKEWPDFNQIVNSERIKYFNSFAPLIGSLSGFVVHIMIRYIFNNKRRIVVSIINIFGFLIWLLFLLITPDKFWIGIVLRSFQGFVLGGNALLTPTMILEIAPPRSTGMFGGFAQIGKSTGFLIFYLIGAFSQWRVMVIVAAVICLLHAGLIILTPEQNETSEFLRNGINSQEIQSMSTSRKSGSCCAKFRSYESIFSKKYSFHIFCGMMMMVFQQFCGINAINANLTTILENSGLRIDANLKSVISTVAQWLAIFIFSFIIDACGRKALWIVSSIGLFIGLVMFSVGLKLEMDGWYPALCVFIIQLFFGFGLGPIPWFIGLEIFPKEVKIMGQALITFAAMIATFAVVFFFPLMQEELSYLIEIVIFTCITFLSFIFGFWCVPNPIDYYGEGITVL